MKYRCVVKIDHLSQSNAKSHFLSLGNAAIIGLMSLKRMIFTGILLSISTLGAILPKALYAQQQTLDVTVSPSFFEFREQPGGVIKEKIRLRNNTSAPVAVRLGITKLSTDESGQLNLSDVAADDETVRWITYDSPRLVAQPREWTDIPFTLTIPPEAAFGYYWALTVNQDTPQSITEEPAATIRGAAAVPILLRVDREGASVEGSITSFKSNQGFYEYLPTDFSLTFQNNGNVHIKPRGNVFITDWRGKEVGRLEVNEDRGNILPNAPRTFTTTWNDSFIVVADKMEDGKPVLDKDGKVQKKLEYRFDKILDLRMGKYTAKAIMVVSGDQRDIPYEVITSFWVFPWKIVLGTLLVASFAFLGIASTLRSIIRKVWRMFRRG